MTDPRTKHRRLIRLLVALGLAATLGGCIVVPLGGPGYYRPHPHYYY
jgi:hypothetical protein